TGGPRRRRVASTSNSHSCSPYSANTSSSRSCTIRARLDSRPITSSAETSNSGRSLPHCPTMRSIVSMRQQYLDFERRGIYLHVKIVMPTMSNARVLALTAIAPIVWGTTYLVTTELLPDGRPLLAGVLRALPAGLILVAATRSLPRGSWWWRSLVLGTLNIGAF